MKGDIGACKSVPLDVKFRMENSLHEFVRIKQSGQEAFEFEHPYGPNVSQFEGYMPECEEEVQEIKISTTTRSSGKREKHNSK